MDTPSSGKVVVPDPGDIRFRVRGRVIQIDTPGRSQSHQHRLVRAGQRVQPVPALARPPRHSGIGFMKGLLEPVPALLEPAPDARPVRRIVLTGLIGFRLIRVEKKLLVIHQQQVNLHGGAWLSSIPQSYSEAVGSRKGGRVASTAGRTDSGKDVRDRDPADFGLIDQHRD